MTPLWNPIILGKIDSEGAAWLAGWLHMRGGLTHYKGHSYLNLFIPFRDRNLVPIMQGLLEHRGVVVRDRGKSYFRIRVNADGMEARLAELGVGEGLAAPRIGRDLQPHFFRAVIESRGSWRFRTKGWFLQISHKDRAKLEGLRAWLARIGCKGRMSVLDQGDVHVMRLWSIWDLIRAHRAIYSCGPRFTIQRQREMAERAVLRLEPY